MLQICVEPLCSLKKLYAFLVGVIRVSELGHDVIGSYPLPIILPYPVTL